MREPALAGGSCLFRVDQRWKVTRPEHGLQCETCVWMGAVAVQRRMPSNRSVSARPAAGTVLTGCCWLRAALARPWAVKSGGHRRPQPQAPAGSVVTGGLGVSIRRRKGRRCDRGYFPVTLKNAFTSARRSRPRGLRRSRTARGRNRRRPPSTFRARTRDRRTCTVPACRWQTRQRRRAAVWWSVAAVSLSTACCRCPG